MCSLPILHKSDNHRLGWPQIVGWMPVQRVELGTMMRNHEFEETPWNFQLFSWWNLCFLCSVLLFGFLGVFSTGEGVCSNGFQLSIFLSQYACGCLYKVAKECDCHAWHLLSVHITCRVHSFFKILLTSPPPIKICIFRCCASTIGPIPPTCTWAQGASLVGWEIKRIT